MLRTSRELLGPEGATITGITREGEDGLVGLSFRHEGQDDAWTLAVGSRVYPMPFEGTVWISPKSGEVARIQWHAANLPSKAEVAEVEWSVSFGPATIGGKLRAVPVKATYTVVYASKRDRTDRNETLFSDFRQYGSEVKVSFEDEPASAN
jgi:hypothetical protein